ncbi:hypothetical protein N7462_003614 [Penicillium macrosclerotiorum]|uniref:uncharacterized protein n=1 Tax=Penicillium macrosclerotiorum TaxID=303699 RepID=UPI0025476D06|nr:uncharacterized protein N7462_003614 [Penicillium macrosclerotiorum]KAJ5689222.1 hypothetical protein N7462_003614 [Penicillium macrosclerotiorum]
MSADQPLEDRIEHIELPSLPRDVAKKMSHLEEQFHRVEIEQMRKAVPLMKPLFEKRNEIISHPEVEGDFWMRVFSSAPGEIEDYILPQDAGILGQALKNLTIERFEVDAQGNGEPRSLRFTFDFKPEDNEWFENTQLVKDFYWRKQVFKTPSGKRRTWEGLVSEPVRINWKKDADPTKGLLDAACNLADAEKKGGERTKLPEFEALVKKIAEIQAEADKAEEEEDDEDEEPESPAGTSFFSFFGYRGRDVSVEESKQASKEEDERYAKILKGEEVDDEDEDDDEEDLDLIDELQDVEIFEDGEELAIAISEDLYTNAMKYYAQSFELGDDLDDLDMEELEGLEDIEEDLEEDEDEGEGQERPRKKARN